MKGNLAAGNALWLIGGRLAQSAISLVVGILTARYLGPSDYGLIHYAAGITGFFAAFCTLGLPSVLVRELLEGRQEGTVLGTALVMQYVSSVCSAAAILFLQRGQPESLCWVMVWSCGAMVLRTFDTFHLFFQARQRSKVTAVILLAAHSAAMAYRAALLILGKSVVWFAFGSVLECLWTGGLLIWAYRREEGPALGVSREMARQLWEKSRHFILPGLMVAVYAQTDKVMLTNMLGQELTGFYSAAVSLCNGWCFVLSAIIEAMTPEILGAYHRSGGVFERKNRQLYAVIFWISAGMAVVFGCFGRPLVGFAYGDDYLEAVAPLKILGWYTAFSYLGVARNPWIVCREAQSRLVWAYAAAAVANVVLNWQMIPRWGVSGAAAASLAAQMLSAVAVPWLIPELRENSRLMMEAMLLKNLRNREEIP